MLKKALKRRWIIGDCDSISGLCSNNVDIDALSFVIWLYEDVPVEKWIAKNSAMSLTEAVLVSMFRFVAKSYHNCWPLWYCALVLSRKLLDRMEAMHGEKPMSW